MSYKRRIDDATHGRGQRNWQRGQGSDQGEIDRNAQPADRSAGPSNGERAGKHYIDPAEEAMNWNPNLSPPIRWSSETPSRVI